MADQARLRGVIGVDVGASEAQSLVPGVGRRLVLGTAAEISLGSLAGRVSIIRSTANIDELVADAVEDNVGVESFLLTLVDDRVLSLEGELASLAAVQRLLELDGRSAGSEVEAKGRGLEAVDYPKFVSIDDLVKLPARYSRMGSGLTVSCDCVGHGTCTGSSRGCGRGGGSVGCLSGTGSRRSSGSGR